MPNTNDDPVHTLEVLAEEVGKPKLSLLPSILAGSTDADLIKIGRTIATSRIVVDTARLYRQAFLWWKDATPAHQKLVRGVTKPLLVLAIHQAYQLELLRQQREGKSASQGASRAGSEKAAAEAFAMGLGLRDQAYDTMRDAAGTSAPHRAEVEAAVGTAPNADALAKGLLGLRDVLQGWLSGNDKALLDRLELAALDGEYGKELEGAAKRVRATVAEAGQQGASAVVTQGALDREDGVNVLLLGQIVRAFDAAHNINPVVPRLVPISTRRLFGRAQGKKVGHGPEEVRVSGMGKEAEGKGE
jgi:hypothetical protein